MDSDRPLRDPWVAGGLLLLALLSVAAVALYRSAPESLAEARAESWVAVRPDAFGANLSRARQLLAEAERLASTGGDSAAVAADSLAATHAARARQSADGAGERGTASALWAKAMLAGAERLQRMGTGEGLHPDDNDLLRRALQRVESVITAGVGGPWHARALEMRSALERQLRTGPLEWLPR
ncbi:MAG TPA: hypothetical protein VFI96_00240 [Longimicrobiaceae bacterium]|nr:hypothetical protein [Longimicrobiaceae bacterium]